jgi:tricorn protease
MSHVAGTARAAHGGKLLSGLLLALVIFVAGANGSPETSPAERGEILLPRHPAPSPDGQQIAFSYQGDIWVVVSQGGEARRLTVHPGYDGRPVWSPDGDWIAFASNRDGNHDVYVIPVHGGKVRRLTWHSEYDSPTDWTPDSRAVVFQSRRHIRDDGTWGAFLVPLDGGTPFAILPTGVRSAVLAPDGKRLAYVRGSVYWWRRGYEGSGRYRLWLFETETPLLAGSAGWPGMERGDEDRRAGGTSSGSRVPSAPSADEICTSPGLLADASLRPHGYHTCLSDLGREGVDARDEAAGRNWIDDWDRGPDWTDPNAETGVNSYPQWCPDGDHIVYLSESGGIANLKILSISGKSRAWLTRFSQGRLRFPMLARDGSLAAFEYEDAIYTVAVPEQLPPAGSSAWPIDPPQPRRLQIRIPIDALTVTLDRVKVASGADEMVLSPDGEQVAFVYEGEIFAMKTGKDEPFAQRLTDNPSRDCQIAWMPDSESLIFVSDRAGSRDIYSMRSREEDEPRLARALRRDIARLTDDPREEWEPKVSPDGERIAYLRGTGTLMTMNADGSAKKVLMESALDMEFAWSPDSKWLVYAVEDNDFNTDVWIIAADGQSGAHNISQHPDDDYSPYWSADGRMIAFVSLRTFLNETDIWYVWLAREDEERSREDRLDALAGKKTPGKAKDAGGWQAARHDADPWSEDDEDSGGDNGDADDVQDEPIEVRIDFTDIHKRLHRLTTFPGDESRVLISKDCAEFVFVSDTDGKSDLWKIKWDGSDPTRLTKGGHNPRFLQWDRKGKEVFYLKEGGHVASVPLKGGETTIHPYASEITIDRMAQRAVVFDEVGRRLQESFYDSDFHGCDWSAMCDHYRPWALGAATRKDFQDVVRMMMGELNASHLGIWGGPGGEAGGTSLKARTGVLGVLFDPTHGGPGLRVMHVVKGTPAERVASRLAEGEIILSANGQSLGPDKNLARILDRTVGRKVLLEVKDREGEMREVVIRPVGAREMRDRIYEEEIEARRRFVKEQTGGKAAYLHVSSMSTSNLDVFERDLYAEAHGKDVLLIDLRGNSGGWTTDLLLTSLMAGDHATTVPRGGGPGYPEDRRLLYAWVKPAVVLCNEHSFSNAEIFSWAMKTLKRAPLVGRRTYGGVISTGGTNLVDGSWLRLPFRGWWSKLDGSCLEGTGCVPDIPVTNEPGEIALGIDRQLERALEAALEALQRH